MVTKKSTARVKRKTQKRTPQKVSPLKKLGAAVSKQKRYQTSKKRVISKKAKESLSSWQRKAEKRLDLLLSVLPQVKGLKKLGPPAQWKAEILVVGAAQMRQLNAEYRKKDYPTDVLSFYTPEPLFRLGFLGELVLCLPVLKSQAKELKHPAEVELDVLLVHGLLHLLGMDHEIGDQQALEMAQWEMKCFQELGYEKGQLGLIDRFGSGRRNS